MLEKHAKRTFQFQQEMRNTKLGMYPEEWSIQRLSDVTEVRSSNVDKKYIAGEQPVLLCNYMDVFNNDYIHNQMKFMEASATDSEIQKFALKTEDVIITKDSETREEIAEPSVVVEELKYVVCGYHLAILRPKRNFVSGFFLKDILRSPNVHQQFVRFANGITRFGLTLSSIRNTLVPLPPLPEQRRIAKILSTWDEAIALTERRIKTARQRKKGLMQRLLTGRVRFPEFVQTQETRPTKLGGIPADWYLARVKNIAQVNTKTLGSNSDSEHEYLYIELSAVDQGNITMPAESQRFGDLPSRARRVLHRGDVIMATVRPNLLGFAICDFEPKDMLCSTGFALISPKDLSDSQFIYQSLYSDVVLRQVHGLVTGSNYPAINTSEVKKLKLFWPRSKEERKKIAAVLQSCDHEIELLTQKRDALQRQKKGLMQRLLTGRVRVSLPPL